MVSEQGPVVDLSRFSELQPTLSVVDALRGVISDPISTTSYKQGQEGQTIEVRLALEGPGMFGLTDWKDNREWSGIFNHSILSARYSLYFAKQLAERGYDINPQTILDGMIVSHSGRRQWDEAGRYPEAVTDVESKRGKGKSNEALGLKLIQGKEVPQDVFDLVAALAHENTEFPVSQEVFDSLEYRICEYVDHRTTGEYLPLSERMGGFLLGYFFKKDEVTPELRERVIGFTKEIIEAQKGYKRGETSQEVIPEEADQAAEELGASADSDRLKRIDLIRLILHDADTEALLESEGIDPNGINDETAPMPAWEDKLRREYVESARESITGRLAYWFDLISDYELQEPGSSRNLYESLEEEFPFDEWWGSYALAYQEDALATLSEEERKLFHQ